MLKWTKNGKLRRELLSPHEVSVIVAYLQEQMRNHEKTSAKYRMLAEGERLPVGTHSLIEYHDHCIAGIKWYLAQLSGIMQRVSNG